MPTTTPGLRAATAGLAAAGRHYGLLSGGTLTTPGTETAGTGRQATTWPTTDTDGDWTGSQVEFVVPADRTVTGVAQYGAASGGDMLSWTPLTRVDNGTTVLAPEGFGSAAPFRWTPSLSTTSL